MGRTLAPFRSALDMEIKSWAEYRRGLRPKDRLLFDILIQFARQHADCGSLVSRPLLSEVLFFSFAIEQQKLIENLIARVETLSVKIESIERQLSNEKHEKVTVY